ncbi:MAG: hypothetical protein WD048_12185 [Chitinophagales bacterium]
MKFTTTLLFSFILLFASCDQTAQQINTQKSIYRSAMDNGDLLTAINAVYYLNEYEPENAWKDTLIGLYFGRGAYVQTVLLGEKLMEGREKDTTLMEYMAFSKEALGMHEESLKAYEKLYDQTKKLNYLYQIASLQFNLRRYNECVSSLNKITQDPEAEETKVNIRYGRGETQEVPVMAAVFNINGVLAMQQQDFKSAEASFQKALEIFPDFALAKGNIQAMAQQQEQSALNGE